MPFDNRFRFNHFEDHILRQSDAERTILIGFDDHFHTVLQEGRLFTDKVRIQFNLFICFKVHECVHTGIFKQVRMVLLFQTNLLHFCRRAETFIELAAIAQVF